MGQRHAQGTGSANTDQLRRRILLVCSSPERIAGDPSILVASGIVNQTAQPWRNRESACCSRSVAPAAAGVAPTAQRLIKLSCLRRPGEPAVFLRRQADASGG